jgi:hypothetical protein
MTSLKEAAGAAESAPAPDAAVAAPVAAVGGAGEAEFCDKAGREKTKHRKNENEPTWEIRIKTLPGEPYAI